VAQFVGTGPLGEIDANHGFWLEPDTALHLLRRESLTPSARRGLPDVVPDTVLCRQVLCFNDALEPLTTGSCPCPLRDKPETGNQLSAESDIPVGWRSKRTVFLGNLAVQC
jgi:hypothetical protein